MKSSIFPWLRKTLRIARTCDYWLEAQGRTSDHPQEKVIQLLQLGNWWNWSNCLVVAANPIWKMMSSSNGSLLFPYIWKNKNHVPTTNQGNIISESVNRIPQHLMVDTECLICWRYTSATQQPTSCIVGESFPIVSDHIQWSNEQKWTNPILLWKFLWFSHENISKKYHSILWISYEYPINIP